MSSPSVGDNADYSKIVEGLDERFEENSLNTRGLEHCNVYTLGQLLPVLRAMVGDGAEPKLVPEAKTTLETAVAQPGVRVEGQDFPANGYLTYWALCALDAWGAFDAETAKPSLDWSQGELYRQLTFFGAGDDAADAYQLGYNLLVQKRFAAAELKDSVAASALSNLFATQLPGGLWEKKEPIFRYGNMGDAHPFTFELLNAIHLEYSDDASALEPHEEHLERAVGWAARNAYGGGDRLWRSGHLATNRQPESWATAEVYYFLQNYRAHLAERILGATLREVGRARPARAARTSSFAELYQPAVAIDGTTPLVGDILIERMLEPLKIPGSPRSAYSLVRQTRRAHLPRSGIFFGPPGTGKTTYAKAIADYLGWPLLTLSPSDFAAEGMLQIPVVGRRLFDRLLEVEDTVIFFDEMEELMRKRDDDGTFEQRFLTTSFLPSLQDLRDEAKTIYLVATNNFQNLDEAAQAPRRFDFQFQILPPSYDEKIRLLKDNWDGTVPSGVIDELQHSEEKINMVTLKEMFELTRSLSQSPSEARRVIDAFEPTLASRQDELKAEAKWNSFGTSP